VRALIVDDDPATKALISAILRRANICVVPASNGAEALSLLADVRPEVIVLDMRMPVMDGPTFLRELRARSDATPVVIVSSANAAAVRDEFGAQAAIRKPFTADLLLRTIDRVSRTTGDDRDG